MNDLLSVIVKERKKEYLTFSNNLGKKWSIPLNNMRVGFEIYEPSGIKGKLLKIFAPILIRTDIAKNILNISYNNIRLNKKLNKIFTNCFGEGLEYSFFYGTPCMDQKVTIQVYKDNKIYGYCKIGKHDRIKKLFFHEKEILDLLQQNKIDGVPRCLMVEQIYDDYWIFIQTTQKKPGAKIKHIYDDSHKYFLKHLWYTTKEVKRFEETDYYQSLMFLESHMNLLQKEYRKIVKSTLESVKSYYCNKSVEWGVSHRDFTPWNTCMNDKKLYVFDFEYSLRNAPWGIDRWHFFVQTNYFEKKYDIRHIAKQYLKLFENEKNNIEFKNYLLDIISLYLQRGSHEDIVTAGQRAKLLCILFDKEYM